MVVLPQDQIDAMVEIMECILKTDGSSRVTVGDIKRKYKITEDEYQMIYDLCMPILRKKNTGDDNAWRTGYLSLKQRLYAMLRHDRSETANKIRIVLQQDSVSIR